MIDKIKLAFGSSSKSENLEFRPQTVNIFVGPNNSGKSTLLREIEQYLNPRAYHSSPRFAVVKNIAVSLPPNPQEVLKLLQPYIESEIRYDHQQDLGLSIRKYNLLEERGGLSNFTIPKSLITNRSQYAQYGISSNGEVEDIGRIVHLFTLRLDGETRLNLVNSRKSGSVTERPKNVLVALLSDRQLREEVRKGILDAIDLYLALDLTDPSTIVVKLSQKKPEEVHETQWGEEAVKYHHSTQPVTSYGDGIKAFVGLILATAIPDSKIILVDEPEAFLHPPLANKLGTHLSNLAERQNLKMFFATHSADFLMGCVKASRSINIVRLTYKADAPTARLLDGSTLSKLLDDPIMRQSNVLSGLFHEGVLLTEDDMNRVFYQEISTRLRDAGRAYAKDCLFLNFNGKDAMHKVVKPLRAMGIPTVCLLDFDFVVDAGQTRTFTKLVACINMPEATAVGLKQARQTILNRLNDEQRKGAKYKGLYSFDTEQRTAVENILEQLAQYGIFVVPSGEVESFLPELGEKKEKRDWFFSVMRNLGSEVSSANYVKPGVGDVWAFIEQVSSWLANPNRKGMPV